MHKGGVIAGFCGTIIVLLQPRVNNKEGKRVLNVLYTPCSMFSASNVTCSRAHVTSPRG